MRVLASIQRIKALDPIENADAIVKATVLGWQLVVKKDEFQIGELCVYCEIDSILPDRPEFSFLASRGWRIRTIRLRGQVSQGICFPLSVLPRGTPIVEGSDVTEVLGIRQYDPPVPAHLTGKVRGPFPSFIPKTDETRVQVLEDLLTKYAGTPCYVTEKLDGSSATYYIRNGQFGVCSRSLDLLEDEPGTQRPNSFWRVARQLGIEERLQGLGRNIAVQGELIGEGVQGNKYRIRGQSVRFFNAFAIDEYRYLNFAEFTDLMAELGLETVPVLDANWLLVADIPALVAASEGKSLLADTPREGIVIRPLMEHRDTVGSALSARVSFKAISPAFLLKFEEA